MTFSGVMAIQHVTRGETVIPPPLLSSDVCVSVWISMVATEKTSKPWEPSPYYRIFLGPICRERGREQHAGRGREGPSGVEFFFFLSEKVSFFVYVALTYIPVFKNLLTFRTLLTGFAMRSDPKGFSEVSAPLTAEAQALGARELRPGSVSY